MWQGSAPSSANFLWTCNYVFVNLLLISGMIKSIIQYLKPECDVYESYKNNISSMIEVYNERSTTKVDIFIQVKCRIWLYLGSIINNWDWLRFKIEIEHVTFIS